MMHGVRLMVGLFHKKIGRNFKLPSLELQSLDTRTRVYELVQMEAEAQFFFQDDLLEEFAKTCWPIPVLARLGARNGMYRGHKVQRLGAISN